MKSFDWFSLVKFVAFMAAVSKIVGSNSSSITNEIRDEEHNKKELTKPLDSCSLIVVSTLDGKLSALDARLRGEIRWSLPALSGPLLSSSLSSLQGGKQVRIVPSLDGGLYQINGDNIEPIPYTADNLLGSFFKLQDGSMLVGGKEAISCGIDPKSGKVRYLCSADGCQLIDDSKERHVQDSELFVVKRTQQTIRAVDQRTGGERWNFSVGQQDVVFLDAPSNSHGKKCPIQEETVEWKLRVSIPDGLIAAVNFHDMPSSSNDIVLWSHQFDSPIAAVWMLHGSFLKSVDLFSDDVMPGLRDSIPSKEANTKPLMYLGSHNGQVYIQHSKVTNSYIDSMIAVQPKSSAQVSKRRAIVWQPKLATSASRTPTVVSKEIAVWNPVEYPFDNGYYFFGDVRPVIPPHENRIEDLGNNTANKTKEDNVMVDKTASTLEYWKGAVFVVVLLVAVAQYVFRYFLPKKQATTMQRLPFTASTNSSHLLPTGFQREQSIVSTASSASLSNFFVSRYLTDFEHELCLGKGGFGVVFQAKNKVDDCQYAVKRIQLPNCDEARKKVMREVKALAKLEHPSIVRYYNSWFEAPSVDWLKDNEHLFLEDRSANNLIGLDDDLAVSNANGYISHKDMVIRKRKATSSVTKFKQTDNVYGNEPNNRHETLATADDDLSNSLDINDLENDPFFTENDTSDSFRIEFADPSRSENIQSLDLHKIDSKESDGRMAFNGKHQPQFSRSSKTSSQEICASFTTSGQSLLSGKHHKCKSKKCTQDKLQAPLYLYIQMQLCRRESLKEWLKTYPKRNYLLCLDIFEQIVHAVEYFHGQGMMHRDLKPSNIFFSLDGCVKVGDFGLVTASVQEPSDSTNKGKDGFIDANHTGQVGTHLYMSPEQMAGQAYSYKVDVFSLGLIFFELFQSFTTEMERIKIMSEVRNKNIPKDFIQSMSHQTQLVKWMLSDSPKNRPTATEIRVSDVYRKVVEVVQKNTQTKAEESTEV